MHVRKLKPIRPGDNRFVSLTFKNHDSNRLYSVRKTKQGGEVPVLGPLEGTKTFVFEIGSQRKQDITLENADSYLPNRGTIHDNSARDFIKTAMKSGVRARVGERTRGKRESDKFRKLLEAAIKTNWDAYKKSPTYRNYKQYLESYCKWAKVRHRIIKREIVNSLKDGSVESIYGTAHSTIAADLRKAGINPTVSIEPTVFNWFEVVIRKAEKRIPLQEIDYKRAFVPLITYPALGKQFQEVERALREIMVGKVSESVLDEMIANPKNATRILFGAVGVKGESGMELAQSLSEFGEKYPYWRDFYMRHLAAKPK